MDNFRSITGTLIESDLVIWTRTGLHIYGFARVGKHEVTKSIVHEIDQDRSTSACVGKDMAHRTMLSQQVRPQHINILET